MASTDKQKEAVRFLSERMSKLKRQERPALPAVPEIGTEMPDGTIYAGLSPETDQPMYAAPFDARSVLFKRTVTLTFDQAAEYAKDLEVGRKKGFRVPTKDELKVLFQNREKGALKGTFNLLSTGCWYWSSHSITDKIADGMRFTDGTQMSYPRTEQSSVRCVRD